MTAPGSIITNVDQECVGFLDQTTHPQVLLDDDIVDGGHDEANLHGIGGTGEMGIDLLALMLVERDKTVEDVLACRIVIGTAW